MTSISNNKRRLGVNIDHIATLREARKSSYPEPFQALSILQDCLVDQVTIHLREDRRHIQDLDLKKISESKVLPVNLEMAVTDEMVQVARHYRPKMVTFVPENRQEVTTEGGLDCIQHHTRIKRAIQSLKEDRVHCSLFVDPDPKQVEAAHATGADAVEIHTGAYCNLIEKFYTKAFHYNYTLDPSVSHIVDEEVSKIKQASQLTATLGMKVYAGHGLHCHNLAAVIQIPEIEEYNIGHAIIARAIFVGLKQAVQEIQNILSTH